MIKTEILRHSRVYILVRGHAVGRVEIEGYMQVGVVDIVQKGIGIGG